jgi:hypothetical protein
MDEKKRTKLLGGVLAAVLVVGFIGPMLYDSFMDPVYKADARLKSAQSNLEKEKEKEFQLMQALNRIDNAQLTSLPNDEYDAQRLYQEWINNLVQQCRFAQPLVTPGRIDRRTGKYVTVSVAVEAETDLDGLSRFLHLFEQADLLHRISSLEIKSTGTQGNPRMDVSLIAEGMSVAGSANRSELFPRSELTKDLDATSVSIQVNTPDEFPSKLPFNAQVGAEMVRVESVEGNQWTVVRGIEGTTAAAHGANTIVQLFPIAFAQQDQSFDRYAALLDASPFVKPAVPRVYNPRLASISDQTIHPGDQVSLTAGISDLNADIGEATFALETEVEGLTIDPATGAIKWQTDESTAPATYTATVVATQKNNTDLKLTQDFSVIVKLPNEAPVLETPEPAVVVLGREFILTVAAKDDGPAEKLNFSLEGDSIPQGLAVDSSNGTLTWQPPLTFKPGEYSVQVKVSDSGDPAKSATGTVTLKVQDDSAATTFLTGTVSKDGVLEAWFWNRANNTDLKLRVDDRLTIADIDAQIVSIDKRTVTLNDRKGIWQLSLGKSLRELVLIQSFEAVAEPTDGTAAQTETTETETAEAPVESEGSDAPQPNSPPTDYDQDPPEATSAGSAESL